MKPSKKRTPSLQSNMKEVQWWFGVALLSLALGALNVCMASWNQEITKAFWSAMFNPVSASWVFVKGHGSCSRTMTPNTLQKAPRNGSDKTLDCCEVANNESRYKSHWTSVGRSENSSCEKAPFKSGRTGAVCTRRVGQTASREVEEAHSCPQAVLPNIKSRVSIVLSMPFVFIFRFKRIY